MVKHIHTHLIYISIYEFLKLHLFVFAILVDVYCIRIET